MHIFRIFVDIDCLHIAIALKLLDFITLKRKTYFVYFDTYLIEDEYHYISVCSKYYIKPSKLVKNHTFIQLLSVHNIQELDLYLANKILYS